MLIKKNYGRFATGNLIDPKTGEVQFLLVNTKFAYMLIASMVTLLVCGIIALGLILYTKRDVDHLERKVDEHQLQRMNNEPPDSQEPHR